jgi:hypothetical protein
MSVPADVFFTLRVQPHIRHVAAAAVSSRQTFCVSSGYVTSSGKDFEDAAQANNAV